MKRSSPSGTPTPIPIFAPPVKPVSLEGCVGPRVLVGVVGCGGALGLVGVSGSEELPVAAMGTGLARPGLPN